MVMKKIQSLQLLVYVAFGLLFIQDGALDAWQGFKDGLTDVVNINGETVSHGPPLQTVFDGSFITHKPGADLKVGNNYILQNITISSDVWVDDKRVDTHYLITGLQVSLTFVVLFVMIAIAYTTNKVIRNISEGTMFEFKCVKQIKNIGLLLMLYALLDFAYQQVTYHQQVLMIHAPLKVLNASAFNFSALILAILLFIIAEAFKKGARLKDELSLTI
ncbi:Protein of unknown function [Mucilaginibacter pineti]|uniref:DUF2975 domain-containing protein n=2 Tax=Mucilaginibacter pineti TaxID=1391627 RepID=A0A1G7BIL3_9SPHI|nr:Protein of unknown function [Mucilaginibacter pineti]